jgi:hypothetical protein
MNEFQSLGVMQIDNERIVDSVQLPDAFSVCDDGSANWVIRQIIERRAYAKRCAEWCEHEQSRARQEEEFFLHRFGQQLLDFARQKIATQGGRRKSVNLPAGVIGFRHEGPKLMIDDEAAVIVWAKEHNPQVIKIVEQLSKSALNQHLEETGEVPGVGVRIEPAREKFYIR